MVIHLLLSTVYLFLFRVLLFTISIFLFSVILFSPFIICTNLLTVQVQHLPPNIVNSLLVSLRSTIILRTTCRTRPEKGTENIALNFLMLPVTQISLRFALSHLTQWQICFNKISFISLVAHVCNYVFFLLFLRPVRRGAKYNVLPPPP